MVFQVAALSTYRLCMNEFAQQKAYKRQKKETISMTAMEKYSTITWFSEDL